MAVLIQAHPVRNAHAPMPRLVFGLVMNKRLPVRKRERSMRQTRACCHAIAARIVRRGMPPIMSSLANDMHQTVCAACLWLPSRRSSSRTARPIFAFAQDIRDLCGESPWDGRVGLWLPAARGAQEHHLRRPGQFFRAALCRPARLVGVRLDRNLEWRRIAALVREAMSTLRRCAVGADRKAPPQSPGLCRAAISIRWSPRAAGA